MVSAPRVLTQTFSVRAEGEMVVLILRSGFFYRNAVHNGLRKMAPCLDTAVWYDNLKVVNSTGSSPLVFDFSK